MNYDQIAWAQQHDWYVGSKRNEDGTLTAFVYDSELQYSVPFTNFKKLRAWAGY